jgi:hypothetical protein
MGQTSSSMSTFALYDTSNKQRKFVQINERTPLFFSFVEKKYPFAYNYKLDFRARYSLYDGVQFKQSIIFGKKQISSQVIIEKVLYDTCTKNILILDNDFVPVYLIISNYHNKRSSIFISDVGITSDILKTHQLFEITVLLQNKFTKKREL